MAVYRRGKESGKATLRQRRHRQENRGWATQTRLMIADSAPPADADTTKHTSVSMASMATAGAVITHLNHLARLLFVRLAAQELRSRHRGFSTGAAQSGLLPNADSRATPSKKAYRRSSAVRCGFWCSGQLPGSLVAAAAESADLISAAVEFCHKSKRRLPGN